MPVVNGKKGLSHGPLGTGVAVGVMVAVAVGMAVLVGRGATTPARLAAVHARLDHWAPTSRAVAAGTQVAAAGILAALALGPVVGLVTAGALTGAWAVRSRVRPARSAATPPAAGTALSG